MSSTKTARGTQWTKRNREIREENQRRLDRLTEKEAKAMMDRFQEPSTSYRQDNPFACLED